MRLSSLPASFRAVPLALPLTLLAAVFVVASSRGLAAETPTAEPVTEQALAEQAPAEQPAEKPAAAETLSVEALAERVKKSVVVITFTGRGGEQQGLGSGFVISHDGLIATNLHVIGEARPIHVRLADGRRFDVTSVHASDRAMDLALIKIDAQELPALELGDSDAVQPGQAIVAVGNPHGLEHSVVAGVISGTREIDGRSMIQLAIPIEPGNSGGPFVDSAGRVLGLLTMKSLVTRNLGFAVPINALKTLQAKPNPVPMERWLTINTLDTKQWTVRGGARWRQRAGRVMVDGAGEGIGGRSLCISSQPVPASPYEVAVTVKLADEGGAAGLVFAAEGEQHFGFYPSAGEMRLAKFAGPDVYDWQVLHQQTSPHYRTGEWNTIKVRVEAERVIGFVNGQQVVELALTVPQGNVGLAKFRDTRAEFKHFQMAAEVPSDAPSPEVIARVQTLVEGILPSGPLDPALLEGMKGESTAGVAVLRERAKRLEQQAAQLQRLAAAVEERAVLAELAEAVAGDENAINTFKAALLIARLDNHEVDVSAYLKELDAMAAELAVKAPAEATEEAKLAALAEYLFELQGFHGSRADYYNRANSYVNEVLEDREGLPLTLSMVYMELAQRMGVNVVGIGLPGHFVVQHLPKEGPPQLIDVYEGAKPISRAEAEQRVMENSGQPLDDQHLAPVGKKQILQRMLQNLLGIAQRESDTAGMLRYLDALLTIAPDAAEQRLTRALMKARQGDRAAALSDVDWLLEHDIPGLETDRVRELRSFLEHAE